MLWKFIRVLKADFQLRGRKNNTNPTVLVSQGSDADVEVDSNAGTGDSIAVAVGHSEAPAVRSELDYETNPTSHLLSIKVTAV